MNVAGSWGEGRFECVHSTYSHHNIYIFVGLYAISLHYALMRGSPPALYSALLHLIGIETPH